MYNVYNFFLCEGEFEEFIKYGLRVLREIFFNE